jgi:Tol biopolymer transport system component
VHVRGRLARFVLLGSVAFGLVSLAHVLGFGSAPRADASVVCTHYFSLEHSWSPDGAKLALATRLGEGYDTEIVLVNAADGQVTALTQNDTEDRAPVFSPDGDRLAYVGGGPSVHVVDLASGQQQKIGEVPSAYSGGPRFAALAWSPDGTKLAFATRWLYLVNPHGGEPVRLSETEVSSDDTPAWSPDGTRIAFVSRYTGSQDLFVVNADGSGETRFPDSRWEHSPAWSPSEQLAFFLGEQIHVMDFDGSNRRAIGLGSAFASRGAGLRWSPDGRALAFHGPGAFAGSCGGSSSQEIYTVSSDGGEMTNLTNHPAADFDPQWLPDGERISFQADANSIYVMDRDGSNLMRIWPDRSFSRPMPEPWRPVPPPPPPPPPPPLPDPERASTCAVNSLLFRGVTYFRRDLRGLRPARLLGTGTYRRCSGQPLVNRSQVRVRRILGVSPRRAVAVSRTIYVSARCAGQGRRLLRCVGAQRRR